eukprot:3821651-Amphidinium_carterae.1
MSQSLLRSDSEQYSTAIRLEILFARSPTPNRHKEQVRTLLVDFVGQVGGVRLVTAVGPQEHKVACVTSGGSLFALPCNFRSGWGT